MSFTDMVASFLSKEVTITMINGEVMKFHGFCIGLTFLIFTISSACGTTITKNDTNNAPENEMIVFASDRDGIENYYRIDPEDLKLQKIYLGEFPPNALIDRPTWSSTLKKYIFSATINGNSDIYSNTWDGSILSNLTNTTNIFETAPMLSPNEKYIAYISSEYQPDVMVMNSDGTDPVNLTKYPTRYGLIEWSPNSKLLFFSSNRAGTPNIYSIKPDGEGLSNISQGKGLDGTFSLSPDGKTIVFDSDRAGAMDIFSIDINGNNLNNLTNHPARDVEPIWSPDGEKIAFKSDRNGEWDIFIMNTDGSALNYLTQTPTIDEVSISWSPDSQFLIYTARINEQSDVFLLAINGKEPINISNHPANDYGAKWLKLK